TMVAAVVAILTLYFGFQQFSATQIMQRQTLQLQREALNLDREYKTVNLFSDYTKLMREESADDKHIWIGNTVIFIAEMIYKCHCDWEETVNKAPYGRTLQHQPLDQGPARCALKAYVPRLITSPSSLGKRKARSSSRFLTLPV